MVSIQAKLVAVQERNLSKVTPYLYVNTSLVSNNTNITNKTIEKPITKEGGLAMLPMITFVIYLIIVMILIICIRKIKD